MSNNFISSTEIDVQENLSLDKLKKLSVPGDFVVLVPRPKDNLIELHQWIDNVFAKKVLSGTIHRFMHNKIVMDGSFVQFCEEQNIKITPLFLDGVVSWKVDKCEKFFMQGIFYLEKDNMKFIHSALFVDGEQSEDEIAFCNFVSTENYEEYLKFRNEYEEWSLKRDRSSLFIKVIDGEDIFYERDHKWEDLFLPDELKSKIKLTVEGFLKSKEFYQAKKISYKRGIIFHGTPGCGKTSLIKTIISNYDFKPVTIFPGSGDEALFEAFAYASEQSPALLFLEDLDAILQNINTSLFLNLMDGVSNKDGILFIGTTNHPGLLQDNVINRPSRFDRKFEIPLPDKNMTKSYLKKWFDKTLPDKELNRIVGLATEHKFSYSHLKDIYVSSAYIAIADDRQEPSIKDVDTAINQIIEEKFTRKGKSIGIDKYLDKKSKKK